MSKTRKQFILYAMVSVAVLLAVLLSVINVINFTMVTEDADQITARIAEGNGTLGMKNGDRFAGPADSQGVDPFGPDSPELPYSVRYFTVRFDKEGNRETVAHNITALSPEEAADLAEELLETGKTGWTKSVYRYRVYKHNGFTYVTVADQSRELSPSYRILLISLVGFFAGLAVCFAFLVWISKKLFRPLEDADRKQRAFAAEAEQQFKVPLTVISANAEILEKENGVSESTQAIRRQVGKMTEITRQLAAFSILETDKPAGGDCDLSLIFRAALEGARGIFGTRNIAVEAAIEPDIILEADETIMRKLTAEVAENAAKYAVSRASFFLGHEKGHVVIRAANDTALPDGSAEAAFDRFTRLENAKDVPGNGLGLTFVRDTVRELHGRVYAEVKEGVFTLRISL